MFKKWESGFELGYDGLLWDGLLLDSATAKLMARSMEEV